MYRADLCTESLPCAIKSSSIVQEAMKRECLIDSSACHITLNSNNIKKNLNAPRPFEHPPVREKNVETFRWDHRLQIQNLFMAYKRVPRR